MNTTNDYHVFISTGVVGVIGAIGELRCVGPDRLVSVSIGAVGLLVGGLLLGEINDVEVIRHGPREMFVCCVYVCVSMCARVCVCVLCIRYSPRTQYIYIYASLNTPMLGRQIE
jgi:hypothetical protein